MAIKVEAASHLRDMTDEQLVNLAGCAKTDEQRAKILDEKRRREDEQFFVVAKQRRKAQEAGAADAAKHRVARIDHAKKVFSAGATIEALAPRAAKAVAELAEVFALQKQADAEGRRALATILGRSADWSDSVWLFRVSVLNAMSVAGIDIPFSPDRDRDGIETSMNSSVASLKNELETALRRHGIELAEVTPDE